MNGTPTLQERLNLWAALNGGAGALHFIVLPDWWLSSLILVTVGAMCMGAAVARKEAE